MTLTSELHSKNSFVRRFIDAEFPHLKQLTMKLNRRLRDDLPSPAPYDPRSSALVGTALDYRIRAYFSDKPHKSGAVLLGLEKLNSIYSVEINGKETRNIWNRTQGAIGEILFETLEEFISDAQPRNGRLDSAIEDRLCRFCVLLAHFDFMYRMGPISCCPSEEFLMRIGSTEVDLMLGCIEANIIKDVVQLSYLFYEHHSLLIANHKSVVAGKVLAGSRDVGGADFDLVVDGCLMEIKTHGKALIETNFLRQLVGYWLLDYDDKFRIRTGAIYLSRYGYMKNFHFKAELLHTTRPIAQIRKSFRNRLRRHKDSATYISPFYPVETISR